MHAATYVLGVVLCLWAGTSEAFWPFTRSAKAVPDSLRQREWKERFDFWKSQPAQFGASLDSVQALPEGGVSLPPGVSMDELLRQAQDQETAMGVETVAGESAGTPTDVPTEEAVAGLAASAADSLAAGAVADTTTAAAQGEASALLEEAEHQALLENARLQAGFKPQFSAKLISNNDRMNLDSSLNAAFSDPSGVTLTSGLTYSDEYNLNQNTNTRSRGMVNNFTLPLPERGLKFSLRTSNSRRDVLGARTTTNERQTTQTDNRIAGLTASIGRRLLRGIHANASYRVDFRYANQDITATGASSGDRENKTRGQSYGVGMNFSRLEWLQLQARVGRALDNNRDISSSFITDVNPAGEQDSSSRGDSVTATVSMPLGPILPQVSANYRLTEVRRSFSDPARTASGATAGGGTFILETEQRYTRALQLRSTFVPVKRLNVDVAYEVSRDSVGYAVRNNAFNDTRRQGWSIRSSLQYHRNGTLTMNYEHGTTDVNRDEVGQQPNPQTREDRDNRLTANLTQTWIGTLKTTLYGEVRLNQGFYVHEGPQGLGDRDDYRTELGLNIEGRINSRMQAAVQSYVRTFDQAFIDPRRSISSRNETEYVVLMDFRYQVTKAFNLSQKYRLSSKVLDEIYNPLRNTLSRNHFLQTNWSYTFNPRLSFGGFLNYILQDNGAYLDDPRTQSPERFFSPTVENRKNEAKVDVFYSLLPNGKLRVTSSQQVTRDRRASFQEGEVTSVNTTVRSNLALGVDSTIKLNDFQLVSRATRNQTLNSSLNRNVFYNIDATLSYTF